MDSSTLLDFALFQLTPTRTRCDLVLFNGGKSEKLASGLFEPFVSHLKFLKDQISKGGYSMKLCPPPNNAPWFTKGTFERFVRFVSTPAVLERFVSIEKEILQIESSVQANELPNTDVTGQLEDGIGSAASANTRKSSDPSKIKSELERSDGSVSEENSKAQLQRLLETRRTLLCKEQAMAYARGLVAGFEADSMDDLISFADEFGASRLREACINFKELWKKKHGDGLWLQELAAMEACPPSELSFLGTPGNILANEFNTLNQNILLNLPKSDIATGALILNEPLDASRSDSTATHASTDNQKDDNSATSDQTPSIAAKVQVPVSWPNQIPLYAYNFQGHIQQLSPYQGYPFPPMQPIPPQYPMNIQWPQRTKESSPAKKEKLINRKGAEYLEDGKTDSSDSEVTDSDSNMLQERKQPSTDAPKRKKHRKKSSKTVVIRNINYITPEGRNRDKNGVSDEYSSDEDGSIDEDLLKQKVDDAVGSLGKLHKLNKVSHGSVDTASQEFDNDLVSNACKGGQTNENWDAFQNILMRDEENVNGVDELHPVYVRDIYFMGRSYGDENSLANDKAIDLELQKVPKQRMSTDDSFVVNQRDGGSEDRIKLEDLENAENFQPIMKRKDSTDEDLVISRRLEESESGLIGVPSFCSTESSIMKPGKGADWFVINNSCKAENHDTTNRKTILNGDCMLSSDAEKSKKGILIDDSFMVHSRPAIDDHYDSQWKTDISMAADLTLSTQLENCNAQDNHEVLDVYEPNDLCMVLERDSGFESARESWTIDHGIDISFNETERRSSGVDTHDTGDKKLPSNSDTTINKKNETNGKKVPVKEVRSKALPRSLGKGKTDLSSMSRPTIQKSKLEKEEEIRKKMEELLIQRQKRIAERTAASKKVPSENKTVKGREMNKTSSVKLRAG